MVSVTERDRDVLRFLWVDDISKMNPDVISLQFARVVFGVSSSLSATIKHHVEKFSSSPPELVKELLRSTNCWVVPACPVLSGVPLVHDQS